MLNQPLLNTSITEHFCSRAFVRTALDICLWSSHCVCVAYFHKSSIQTSWADAQEQHSSTANKQPEWSQLFTQMSFLTNHSWFLSGCICVCLRVEGNNVSRKVSLSEVGRWCKNIPHMFVLKQSCTETEMSHDVDDRQILELLHRHWIIGQLAPWEHRDRWVHD